MTTAHNPQQVPTDALDLSSERSTAHVDRMLDEAIEESFPNSDPVSLAMPHNRIEARDTASGRRAVFGKDAAWPLLIVGGVILALLLGRRR